MPLKKSLIEVAYATLRNSAARYGEKIMVFHARVRACFGMRFGINASKTPNQLPDTSIHYKPPPPILDSGVIPWWGDQGSGSETYYSDSIVRGA